MRQHTLIAALAVGLLTLTACGTGSESDAETNQSASEVTEAQAVQATPEPTSDPSAAGEVCDPQNLNDAICAAFYPETAAENMLSRQQEAVGSLTADQQIELMMEACSVLEAGGTPETNLLVNPPGEDEFGRAIANENFYSAATRGYCQDQMPDDRGAWLVNYYKDLGEEAAKADFADGEMPDTPFDEEMFSVDPVG